MNNPLSSSYYKQKWFNDYEYDKVSANTASWFPKTSEFYSGHRAVKKGSKHLILGISMTKNKVIEYIEITKNTQILKVAVFTV